MKVVPSFLAAAMALACVPSPAAAQKDVIGYIGTYTSENSKGIYAFRFDSTTGKATPIGLVAETSNPSFLAIHPNRRFLYAVNEDRDFQGKPAGGVTAFSIDARTGQLKMLNQVSSGGPGPCHLELDKTGKWLFVANYGGGSVVAYPVHADGSLGESSAFVQHKGSSVTPRQRVPHAHSANPSPDGRFVLFTNLGLDQVLTYRIDATGTLAPADPPFSKVEPGSGPRHLAFHPKGKFAYVVNELAATVSAFSYDAAKGSLSPLQNISMVPADYTGSKGSAEIAVHPHGKFVYSSNRDSATGGKDSITVFAIDPAKGTLTLVDITPVAKIPRSFAIDPTGRYLFAASQDEAMVVLYRIDRETGKLTATGDKLDFPFPVCVTFLR